MPIADLEKAGRLARTLDELLDSEFAALRSSDIDSFERLQTEKVNIIQDLSNTEALVSLGKSAETHQDTGLDVLIDALGTCKEKFQRNELLINKKIEAIKGALHTLRSTSSTQSVELYNKLGKLKS